MFDIDKLFLSTIFYKKHDTKDQSGNILSRSVNTSWKEGTEQYYANKLIFDQIALLKDSKSFNNLETRSMHYGDASIDGDTKLLTDIVDDLEITSDESIDPYDTYSLWRNTQIRDQYITGKFGIGPFALNNNNHILTMLYGVKFKRTPGSILNITGHESLCGYDDIYVESILSWLSGLINAHVDVAKDPFISKLNVNKYTYNLVNLMVRTGFGKTTFYFTTQPIMKELALRVNNAASAYGSNGSKSKYRRQADAENDFILEFANSWLAKLENTDKFNTVFDALEVFENSRLKKLGTKRSDLFESIFSNKSDLLRQIAKSGKNYNDSDAKFTVETKHGTVELTMQDIQMLVYDAKLEFDQYSEALSQLVKYCKIDTKKQGKNISEQRDFMRGYNKLFNNPKSRIRKMFDSKSLKNLKDLSYIETKTNLAISLFEDILSAQLIDATPEFNRQCEFVSRYLPAEEDGDVSKDVMKKISDAILVKIRSDFFNKYAERHGIDIKGLVNGNNTIYDRLNKLKIDIATKEEYEDLRDGEGNIYNYLLNTLTNGFIHEQIETQDEKDGIVAKPQKDTYNNVKFLSTMTFMDNDSIDADEMSESWEELLEDTDHPELQQFARDLIVYSFITNGGNGGSNNIYKYIPTSWLVNPDNAGYSNSFAYHMANELDAYRSGEMIFDKKDADEVILNNWTDNQFIPTVKISDGFQVYYTGRASIDIINGVQVRPQTDIPLLMRCNINTEISSFIKIQRAHDKESQRSVAIYKKIGIVGDIATYVLVDPKGQNFGNKNKIYEYGRNDSAENEVSRQLGFNESLTMLAQQLGADITDVNDVINKLIQFVLSSTNREGSIELIKKYGVKNVLFDTVIDMVDNRSVKDQTEQTGGVNEALEELKNLNDSDRARTVSETNKQNGINDQINTIDINTISDKTEAFGVEISNDSRDFWNKINNGWQADHPQGLVAYRKHGDDPKTFSIETVDEGWIGNPFSTKSRGANTVQEFYDWLVTGNNFGNERATEAFRQAIIQKILAAPENSPVLYYTELNRPSHATVIGYLVNNKHLLKSSIRNIENTIEEFKSLNDDDRVYKVPETEQQPVLQTNEEENLLLEMQDIKDKAVADGTFMKAPNGNPTNLTERQWLQVRTKAFKNWFGDWINDPANASKVVDENGEPLVVYRGDSNGKTQFNPTKPSYNVQGIYIAGNKTFASNYTKPSFYNNFTEGVLYEVFVNAKNPIYNSRDIEGWNNGKYDINDSWIYGNFPDGNGELVVRNPSQIKSATDNNGIFSTENDDIFDQLRALGQELINKCER